MTRDAFLLSPYRPPTSYPVDLDPDEAAAWLSGYFALWHPAVVATLGRPPQPASSYDHDQPAEGAVYAVPAGPHLHQPEDWAARVTAANATAVTATPEPTETRRLLLEALGDRATLPDANADAVRAFAGLGFGYLVVDTLFEAADHDRLLDAESFWADVTAAANALADPAGTDAAYEHLRAAAEKLKVAREALNGNAIALIDMAVLSADTLDTPWPASLHHGMPLTVLASGELLERMQAHYTGRFAELRSRIAPGLPPTVDVVCGAYREREDAVLSAESQWWNLAKARRVVTELFGDLPAVYGRHRTALHAELPGWLRHAGFASAVVTNFDGALTPTKNAAVVNWPGPDGAAIDAFAREPLPAGDPLTFFNLAYHLHTAANQDAAPAVAFAHTGKRAAVGYSELLWLAGLGTPLGAFTGVAAYLDQNRYGEYLGTASADDFFSDYLDDRVTRLKLTDPVSGFAALYRHRRRLDAAFALAALHRVLAAPGEAEETAVARLEALEDAIETRGADADTGHADAVEVESLSLGFARTLTERIQAASPAGRPGLMVFNPCGFARRVGLELPPFPGPIAVDGPVKAAQFDADKTRLVVEVPALGFAWVPRPERAADFAPVTKPRMRSADGTTVRNEFFEAELDPISGGLRAFRDARTRVARFGMQLVFNPGSKARARNVRVTHAGAALGAAVAEGDILDEHDEVLASFRHEVRAWAGRPALEMTVEIAPKRSPVGYPWHAYYAARFAWRDERAALFRGANGVNSRSGYTRPGSPDYVEVRLGAERTYLFTGGLPFAQRHGGRMLDVVLVPAGESCQRFELLLAMDRDYPMATAAGWCAPAPVVPTDRGPPPGGSSGWLGHLDLPSLLLTSLRPDKPSPATPDGRAVTARLLECAGFGGLADLRFAKPPTRAAVIDGTGTEADELTVANGAVPLEFSANEVRRVRAEWPA